MSEPNFNVGIERLVTNTAIEYKLSREQAIAKIEWVLSDLKRKPPGAPTPPVGEVEVVHAKAA